MNATLNHPRPDIRRVGGVIGKPVELANGIVYVRRNTRSGVRWFTADVQRSKTFADLEGGTVDTLIVSEVKSSRILRQLRQATKGEIVGPGFFTEIRKRLESR